MADVTIAAGPLTLSNDAENLVAANNGVLNNLVAPSLRSADTDVFVASNGIVKSLSYTEPYYLVTLDDGKSGRARFKIRRSNEWVDVY